MEPRDIAEASKLSNAIQAGLKFAQDVERLIDQMENLGYTEREVKLVLHTVLRYGRVSRSEFLVPQARDLLVELRLSGNM